jgi:alpha-beta hydrolase superfamily lysophospholipase
MGSRMTTFLTSIFAFFVLTSPLHSAELMLPHSPGLTLRVIEHRPAGHIRGDILYLHGFADRGDNHGPLFKSWTDAGFRVIAFDFPSHGKTTGMLNAIDLYGFHDLAGMAAHVERHTRESFDRPLLLAGWSTGGLLAVRMIQAATIERLGREPAGLILFAPGISVRTLVGKLGFVTEGTLTRNAEPPHAGPIRPKSPLFHPLFAIKLLANAALSRAQIYPLHVPTLILLGGDKEDRYVHSKRIVEWSLRERRRGAELEVERFPGALHELDNEPGPTGRDVRDAATEFAGRIADSWPCERNLIEH